MNEQLMFLSSQKYTEMTVKWLLKRAKALKKKEEEEEEDKKEKGGRRRENSHILEAGRQMDEG